MSRKLTTVLVVVGALGCVIVGSTIAWSNIAGSVGSQAPLANVDLDPAAAVPTAIAHREYTPAIRAKADFDQVFADATATPRRENTPAIREKLRNAGWKRIAGSAPSQ